MKTSLSGKNIAVPETRQIDVLSGLLERRGANVLRCPLVGIHTTPDTEPVLAWVERFNAGEIDDLILLTGEGLRRILGILDNDLAASERFVERLAEVRTITRGPKPAKVLRGLDLKPSLQAAEPTTAGVIKTLEAHELSGRRVGVQLYGTDPNQPLIEFLTASGATPDPVAPYVYADESEDLAVALLVDEIAAGEVDVITFTSSPQIRRLLQVAKRRDMEKALRAGMAEMVIAAVGPVVRDALLAANLHCDLMPESSYFMKPLVASLEAHFATVGGL